MGFLYGFPFISILGDPALDYTSLFMKRENVQRLKDRIEEKKKEREEKKDRNEQKKREKKDRSILSRIRGRLLLLKNN